jgi:hypothetical protein
MQNSALCLALYFEGINRTLIRQFNDLLPAVLAGFSGKEKSASCFKWYALIIGIALNLSATAVL